MKIGVCGTGRMGAAIAQRLMSVGHEVGVWNRDAAKTRPLAEAGAKSFASPAELVDGCEAVIVMLLNDAATEAVYQGANGILKGKLTGKLVIDNSTVRPDTMISMGAAVHQGRRRLCRMSSGRQHGAGQGRQTVGSGGRQRCRRHAGDADPRTDVPAHRACRSARARAPRLKLAVNLPLLVYWQALGEALAICQPLKLAPERLIDILTDTSGAPAAMKGRGPVIAKALAGQPLGSAAFALSAAKKDLATAVAFAHSIHAELPVTASALKCFEEAEAAGLGDKDATAVSSRWAMHPGAS